MASRESDNCSPNGEQGIRQSRSVCGKKAESDWRGRQTTETRIIRISETNKTEPETLMALAEAGRIIREGGLVAFPTETVYGLGGDAMNPESSRKIYAAKGRPSDNPLIVHISDLSEIDRVARKVPETALRLARRFWPGPLTMILEKGEEVPLETTGGLETVAIRMPGNDIAAALIRKSHTPIAAPSANRSGRPSPTLARHCAEDLDGKIEMILDGGAVGIGLESTIVDLSTEIPTILRPGYITLSMIREILPQAQVDAGIIRADSGIKPKAPGMKYRHYAPRGDLTVVRGERQAVVSYINAQLAEISARKGSGGWAEKTAVIAARETASSYQADLVRDLGSRKDPEEIARHLFGVLREMDEENADVIFAEAFDDTGIGAAIMNRLLKAAGGKLIQL